MLKEYSTYEFEVKAYQNSKLVGSQTAKLYPVDCLYFSWLQNGQSEMSSRPMERGASDIQIELNITTTGCEIEFENQLNLKVSWLSQELRAYSHRITLIGSTLYIP